MSTKVVEIPAVYIAGSACSGCTVSLLNGVYPSIQNLLIDPIIPGKHVSLRFHTTVMAGQGEPVIKVLRETKREKPEEYLLIIDGSIPTGENGSYCFLGEIDGKEVTMKDMAAEMSRDALAVIAVGTCASFGGIPSGSPNPTGARSVSDFMKIEGISKPLINIPGCPPHPDWIMGTIAGILLSGLPAENDLDELRRPKVFYGKLIHDNCPRRAYFDAGQFARHPGEPGCLYEIGCKGPVTYADCPTRMWNNGVNWCIGSGAQCIGCVEPDFHDKFAPMFEKLDESALERFKIKTR
ncbi:MAG: hydrogenase small subunit [Spirochaetota bacterium]